MKYKRLTTRDKYGKVYYSTKIEADNIREIYNEINKKDKEIMYRLAELEDKIENGTLIELPCKVGDTVYYIGSLEVRTFFKINTIYDIVEMPFSLDMLDSYKNVWFLTKAEAEQKLKEIQNER
jgi:hypothetical protein